MFKKFQIPHIIITITIICFNIIILTFPDLIISSTKKSLLLWFNNVIPSLYPFIILNNILKEMNGFKILGTITKPLSKLLFKHNSDGGVAFICGITSGYPLGGTVTADLLNKKLICEKSANYFIMFSNNAGPLFIVGTIGVTMFSNYKLGYFLLLNHILSSLLLGIILSFFKEKEDTPLPYNKQYKLESNKKFLNSISNSIINSNETILIIGGFIMFYSIIISILDVTNILDSLINIIVSFIPINKIQAKSIICGFFEMTTGISMLSKNISNLQIDLTIISGILSFGGLSIHGQTLSSVLKTNINVSNYFIGKTFHTVISMLMTYISYEFISFYSSIPTFTSNVTPFYYSNHYIYLFYIIFFILLLFSLLLKQKYEIPKKHVSTK